MMNTAVKDRPSSCCCRLISPADRKAQQHLNVRTYVCAHQSYVFIIISIPIFLLVFFFVK